MAASEDGSGCLVSRGRSQSDPSFLSDSSATSTDAAGENPGTGPGGGDRAGWGRHEAGGTGTVPPQATAPPPSLGGRGRRPDSGTTRARGSCPHHAGLGCLVALCPERSRFAGRAVCSAVCPIRRLLDIAPSIGDALGCSSLARRRVHGSPPHRVGAYPALCPGPPMVPWSPRKGQGSTALLRPRLPGLSLGTRTPARP